MPGRIRRQLIAEQLSALDAARAQVAAPDALPICPLCERPIPRSEQDAHHLVPKSKGGRHTEYLHRICHKQIHALLTETELARSHHTVEALLAHPDIATFVAWVRGKPPEFRGRAFKSERLRRR